MTVGTCARTSARGRAFVKTCLAAQWENDKAALDVLPGPASIPAGVRDILGINADADGSESLGVIGVKFTLFNGR